MARIKTKDGLKDYIKRSLGYPSINIEVTDDQLDDIIDDTVQKFSEYAYGTLEDTVLLELSGKNSYQLPETITNIIQLSKGHSSNITSFGANFGKGFVPNIWSEQFFSTSFTGNIVNTIMGISATRSILNKFFGSDLGFNFNHHSKQLQLTENYHGAVILHYQYEYLADPSNDLIYNHEWIKGYSIAKTKKVWGTVTGKFNQSLLGGATINYADFKQEAEQEIEALNEELLNKWSDPAPILVG